MRRPSKDRWDTGDAYVTMLNICSSVNNRAVTVGEPERGQEKGDIWRGQGATTFVTYVWWPRLTIDVPPALGSLFIPPPPKTILIFIPYPGV